ncbi:MAG TPA: hypothetical protein VGJ29_19155 [Vicinamibacterales bacterium]
MFAVLGFQVPDQAGGHSRDFLELRRQAQALVFVDVAPVLGNHQLRSRFLTRASGPVQIPSEMAIG